MDIKETGQVKDFQGIKDLSKVKDDTTDTTQVKDDSDGGHVSKVLGVSDSKDLVEVKDIPVHRDVVEVKDILVLKDVVEVKDILVLKDVVEVKDIPVHKDVVEVKDVEEVKDVVEVKDILVHKDVVQVKDVVEVKDILVLKDVVEVKDIPVHKDVLEVNDVSQLSVKDEVVEYFCEVCGTLCDGDQDLITHHRIVHGRAISVCELCAAQFKNSLLLYIHCKHAHQVVKVLRCICGSTDFTSVKSMKLHYQLCKMYKLVNGPMVDRQMCHVCGEQFTTQTQYTRHMCKHDTVTKKFMCKTCGQSFSRESTLYNHERNVHTDATLNCPFCTKCLKTRMGILYHVYTHREIQEEASLLSETSDLDMTLDCPLCDYTSPAPSVMKYHILVRHNSKKRKSKNSKPSSDSDDTEEFVIAEDPRPFTPTHMFECEICGRLCNDRGAWRDHVALHSGEVTVVCSLCDRGFVTRHAYRKHMRTNHDIYSGTQRQSKQSVYVKCKVCDIKICRTGLAKHMDIHNGVYRFNCEFCNKSCRTNHDLQVHRRIHTGEKPYKCEVCDRRFSDQANLSHHQKRIHKVSLQTISKVRKTGFHKKLNSKERANMKKWEIKHGIVDNEESQQTLDLGENYMITKAGVVKKEQVDVTDMTAKTEGVKKEPVDITEQVCEEMEHGAMEEQVNTMEPVCEEMEHGVVEKQNWKYTGSLKQNLGQSINQGHPQNNSQGHQQVTYQGPLVTITQGHMMRHSAVNVVDVTKDVIHSPSNKHNQSNVMATNQMIQNIRKDSVKNSSKIITRPNIKVIMPDMSIKAEIKAEQFTIPDMASNTQQHTGKASLSSQITFVWVNPSQALPQNTLVSHILPQTTPSVGAPTIQACLNIGSNTQTTPVLSIPAIQACINIDSTNQSNQQNIVMDQQDFLEQTLDTLKPSALHPVEQTLDTLKPSALHPVEQNLDTLKPSALHSVEQTI